MSTFDLRLLGGASLLAPDGSPVTGRAVHRHRLALLALLARSAPGGLSREKLVGLLWPERDDAAARHLLRAALHDLRQTLGPDALITGGTDVRLDTRIVATDSQRFDQRLSSGDREAAVAEYRGPFLDGFFLERSEPFEEWSTAERARLALQYERALQALAEQADSLGDAPTALRWWRELATAKPADGRVALRVLELQAALGDPAGALAQAAAHARWLRTELGVGPDPALLKAVQRVRASLTAPSPDWIDSGVADASALEPAPATAEVAIASPTSSASATADDSAVTETPTALPEALAEPIADGTSADPATEAATEPSAMAALPGRTPGRRATDRPEAVRADASTGERSAVNARQRWPMRRSLVASVGVVLLAAVAAVPYIGKSAARDARAGAMRSGIATPITTLAVPPFEVVGGAPADLRDGLATLLTANLDQVAELRVVPSSIVTARRRDIDEPNDPTRLLPALRADLLVSGVVARVPEGLAVTARLLDPQGTVRARVELRGGLDDLPGLVDRVSLALLRELWGRQWGVPEPRLAAVSTNSTAALRAFLRGEAFVRAAMWDSAAGALAEAVDLDSTFALAHLRLAEPYGWRYGMASPPSQRALAAAGRFVERLPPRERMLLTVRRLHEDGQLAALDSSAELAERYPDDPEAQYVAADVRFHAIEALGRTMIERAVAAFDTAIVLDSTSARVYAHPVTLALFLGDSARLARYTRQLASLGGGSHMQVADRWDYSLLARVRFASPTDGLRAFSERLRAGAPPAWQLADLLSSAERAAIDAGTPLVMDSLYERLRGAYRDDAHAAADLELRRQIWIIGTGRVGGAREWLPRLWAQDPNGAPALMTLVALFGYAPPGWLEVASQRLASTPYWQESPARRRRAMYWKGMIALLSGANADARTAFRDAADPSQFTVPGREPEPIGHGLEGALRAADAWARVEGGDRNALREVEAGLKLVGYEGDGLLLSRATRAWWTLQLAATPERRAEGIDRIRGELLRGEGYRLVWWWRELARALAADGDSAGAAVAQRRFDSIWNPSPTGPAVSGAAPRRTPGERRLPTTSAR